MDASPGSDWAEFHRRVLADPSLFESLAGAPDPVAFAARAVAAGRTVGLRFTAEDVLAAVQAARRSWIERGVAR